MSKLREKIFKPFAFTVKNIAPDSKSTCPIGHEVFISPGNRFLVRVMCQIFKKEYRLDELTDFSSLYPS